MAMRGSPELVKCLRMGNFRKTGDFSHENRLAEFSRWLVIFNNLEEAL